MSGCRDIIAGAERDTYGFPDGMLFHLVRVLCGLSRGGFNGMALGYLLQASGVSSSRRALLPGGRKIELHLKSTPGEVLGSDGPAI